MEPVSAALQVVPDAEAPGEDAVLVTEVRALPVRASAGQVVRQQAVVAAGSFAVGAAAAAVVARRRSKRAVPRLGGRRGGRALDVAATRSFLVDVHLLSRGR
jgi:hypothetical protein